jgi:hypothetical protein
VAHPQMTCLPPRLSSAVSSPPKVHVSWPLRFFPQHTICSPQVYATQGVGHTRPHHCPLQSQQTNSNGYVYVLIQQGMYSLPRAGIIA